MADILDLQVDFVTGGTVTADNLNNLIKDTLVNSAIIKNQDLVTTASTADEMLIAPINVDAAIAPSRISVQNLLNSSLSSGTYANMNLSNVLSVGTVSANRTISTTGTITTGTIPNLTAGTTTSTLGTITNLSSGTTNSTSVIATSGTIGTLNSTTASITGGTFGGALTSTAGTIATLNSTTGTIANLSTTLAGDFTISQGTGTLGTSGVAAGTYGNSTAYPIVTLDTKGRVTTVSTSAVGGSIGTNSVYFGALSTSTSESTNVSSRVAKGWVNFNGTPTLAVRSSFGIASVARNNTGDYTVNFNTSIGTGMGWSASGGLSTNYNYTINSYLSSSSSVTVLTQTAGPIKADLDYISVIAFGV